MQGAGARATRLTLAGVGLLLAIAGPAPPAAAAPQQFGFPVVPDSDGDGVDDMLELVLGTAPLAADSDGDGVSDGLELARGSDPLLAASVPAPSQGQLEVGLWSRRCGLDGHVRAVSFVYLPAGYPAAGVQMELVHLSAGGTLDVLDETWLAGGLARRTIDFVPVAGEPEALLMVVGANLPRPALDEQGYMSGAVVVWHGAASAPQANHRNRAGADGLWLRHPGTTPILFRRPVTAPGAGGGGGGILYTPIDPEGEPVDWTAYALCHQVTAPVGYEGGLVITRVLTAACEEGWNGYCSPTGCSASVGDEYASIDVVGLVGG